MAKISCKGDYQNTESQLCAQAAHAVYEVTKLASMFHLSTVIHILNLYVYLSKKCVHIYIIVHYSAAYAKISWLKILEPLCVDASPKPKLGDPLLQEKIEDDPIPEFY